MTTAGPEASPNPVLIVDDNEDIRGALAMVLEQHGYSTAEADNGAVALAMLQRDHVAPCLILLDLNMPVMSGVEFRHCQERDPALADIPVVIYSGTDDVRSVAQSLNIPHYFQKPLNLDALVGLVRQHCPAVSGSRSGI